MSGLLDQAFTVLWTLLVGVGIWTVTGGLARWVHRRRNAAKPARHLTTHFPTAWWEAMGRIAAEQEVSRHAVLRHAVGCYLFLRRHVDAGERVVIEFRSGESVGVSFDEIRRFEIAAKEAPLP